MHNFKINEIVKDEFGRPNGILLVKKPVGITSHDVVDQVRRKYQTRKVGHAGTLDPFAEGLLIIMIGKATKLSDSFLGLGKTYEAKILLGVSTWTGDLEGEIKDFMHQNVEIDEEDMRNVFKKIQPSYEQYVPLYSSVKVDGRKLRILARKYPKKQLIEMDGIRKYLFKDESNKPVDEVVLPRKLVQIKDISIIGKFKKIQIQTDPELFTEQDLHTAVMKSNNKYLLNPSIQKFSTQQGGLTFYTCDIKVDCSKGTYVRQLAEDIGALFDPIVPSMLIELKRTRIGDYKLEDATDFSTEEKY